ncbi:SusE domain-containing protein [Tenacibaculum aiptasiae]|uniref:SusE domain-containing protein n=1 Tax=Tenacibaculum aiptasiae TaxID=426481 RepID=UPI003B5B3C28
MKYLHKLSLILIAFTLIFSSCDTEESLNIVTPESKFVLNTPGISNVFLNFSLPDNPAFTITWIDEITGSSEYMVEMALEDTFASPILLGTTDKNSFTMTVSEFNTVLSNANIKSFTETGVYIRLKAGSTTSNTILLQVSKFAVKVPVITSPDNSFTKVLSDADPSLTALTINWDDPEAADNSSVKITYEVEMALGGTNFATVSNIGSTENKSFDISHEALNDAVIAAGGVANTAANFDFRIKAIAKTASGDLFRTSQMITISLTPYKGAVPDNLFMVGSHNGWNNADATQQFYNDGNGVFSRVQMFNANDEFKMLPTSGSWDGDWGEDPTNAGKIVQDGEQNIKVTDAGNYIVIIDFNTLSFKLSKIDNLYMVGAHNGWNNADATQQFNTSGNGVFTRIQTFSAGDEFKMLPTSGSWDGDWGENKNSSGKIIQDDEQNIKVADAGTYMVTVDFNDLSYSLVTVPAALHLVGSINGWDNTTAAPFTKVSEGVFEINQVLTATDEFKFLPMQGSWDNDWGESSKYPGMIVRDGESNVKSPGNGTYKITVDFNKGTVTVE